MRKSQGLGDWTRGLLVSIREHNGQVLGEYSLIMGFIVGVGVLGLGSLGLALAGTFP
jgi:hypothetical protein